MALKVERNFVDKCPKNKEYLFFEKCMMLNTKFVQCGFSIDELERISLRKESPKADKRVNFGMSFMLITFCVTLLTSIVIKYNSLEEFVKASYGVRCIIPNNYFIWEATRPLTDCNMCENLTEVLVLYNTTRESFQNFAYSSRPIIAKGAASNWPARETFSFDYFRNLYENIEGSYESVEDECQILTFKTEFKSLKEFFSMPQARIHQHKGEKPWYIGWSNCHPEILSSMRQHYEVPSFLPADAEHSRTDYVFIGYGQGAVMHIDYISRLMWQAQLRGSKIWRLQPPPDCEHICSPISFRVDPGDIVLLDTRQWYHDTIITPGEMSLTVSSEYG